MQTQSKTTNADPIYLQAFEMLKKEVDTREYETKQKTKDLTDKIEKAERLNKEVEDELFCIMDDDDFYTKSNSISIAVNALENNCEITSISGVYTASSINKYVNVKMKKDKRFLQKVKVLLRNP